MTSMVPTVVRERNIPERMRLRTTLGQIDYFDVFTATAPDAPARTPEDWVRVAVERVAGEMGQFVWRRLVGLRLASKESPEHVGGWEIGGSGDDWIRLEAASWFLATNLVLLRVTDGFSVGTFGRYEHPLGPFIWRPESIFHRLAMPRLLRAAVRSR